MIRLWSINRWLRWTGIRLCIATETQDDMTSWTRIGFKFYGWRDWTEGYGLLT